MFVRKKNYKALVTEVSKLNKNLGIVLSDITSVPWERRAATTGYRSHQAQVEESKRKYQGRADYGNMILQRLVNLRVAFAIPNRLFLIKNPDLKYTDEQLKDTKTFLNEFMAFNNLASALPRELSRESELQGQVVARLMWDMQAKLPLIKYYPWNSTGYEIKAVDNFAVNSKLVLIYKSDGVETIIPDDEFEFIAFNDELCVYEGFPTCGSILMQIENLDKDLGDWRKLNHLFAHPTPHFKCETQEEATAINDTIKGLGWKVGTALATNSDFSLKGVTGKEGNILMLSITTLIKIISAHTGIGPHFLGFANIMSNRATAESMGEPTEVSLFAEITSWKKFYTNLFNKAIRMRNQILQQELRESIVLPKLVPLTDRQWKHLKDIYMPAAEKKLISRQLFLDALPDVDVDIELEKIKEEEENLPATKQTDEGSI